MSTIELAPVLAPAETDPVSAARADARTLRYGFRDLAHKMNAPREYDANGNLMEISIALKRVLDCGRLARGQFATYNQAPNGNASTGGLITCGRGLVCPVCSVPIREARRLELLAMMRAIRDLGGTLDFGTFTLRHYKSMTEDEALTVIRSISAAVFSGGTWQKYKKRYGLGQASTIEATYGKHGPHPHLHMILFQGAPEVSKKTGKWLPTGKPSAPRWTESERLEVLEWIKAKYLKEVAKAGMPAPSPEYALKWIPVYDQADVEGLAHYMTKDETPDEAQEARARGLSVEALRGDLKTKQRSEHTTLTPNQLLLAALAGDKEAYRQYWAHEKSTRGLRWYRVSHGLREALGVKVDNRTDEQIAAEEETKGVPVVAVTAKSWWKLANAGQVVEGLELLEAKGPEVTLNWLVSQGYEAYSMEELHQDDPPGRKPPD